MQYDNIREAIFCSRPNRFIAHIQIDGRQEICHVKNTGRCKELLLPGAEIFVREAGDSRRKTKYDLIAVYKGAELINIDSQVPNPVFREWVTENAVLDNIKIIKPEFKYKNSRLDFFIETERQKILAEIKGVTLERNGVAMFPDAPTERGVKHIYDLCEGISEGFEAWLVFIIQMQGVAYFTPNRETDPAFAEALLYAKKQGVKIMALDCQVTPDSIRAENPVAVKVSPDNPGV